MTEIIAIAVLLVTFAGGGYAMYAMYARYKPDYSENLIGAISMESSSGEMGAPAGAVGEDESSIDIGEQIDAQLYERIPNLTMTMIQAGLKKPPYQYFLGICGGTVLLMVLALSFLNGPIGFLVAFLIIPVVAYIGTRLALSMIIDGRGKLFDRQLGVGLDVLAASLKAGGTFMSSLRFVAESSAPPFAEEMGTMSSEIALGTDIPTAMDRLSERVKSKNLIVFTLAVKVANQTGAALAPIFITLSQTIAERFKLQGMVSTGIAQNQGSILMVAAMPWVIVPILASSFAEAYDEFLKSFFGLLIVAGCFLWYSLGLYLMYTDVKKLEE